jgi:pimeloyl-ACP methyl ester carboxylesterase
MLLSAAAPSSAEVRVSGAWGGGMSFGGWLPLRVVFDAAGARIYSDSATEAQPLKILRSDGNKLHFQWDEEDGLVTFEGMLSARELTGKVMQGERTGIFSLVPIASADQSIFNPHVGVYRFSAGELLWIGRASELRRQPSFVNAKTGRLGILYPNSAIQWTAGVKALPPLPAGPRFTFLQPAGETSGLLVSDGAAAPRHALRLDAYREEEVSFKNGDVTLAGTMVLPRTPGRHAAVVFLHGSGPSSRHYFSSLPYLLAAHGIASLVYDKRGVGGSTGDRHKSTFADLADDALAGLKLLQGRPEIDAERIGIWGHSQGGWTGPLAASRSRDVRFVVMAAGAAVSVDQQIKDQKRRQMQAAGFKPEETAAALSYLDLYFSVRDGKAALADLQKAYGAASQSPWRQHAWKPGTLEEVQNRSEVYDPKSVLMGLRTPVLALLGGKDDLVHPDDNEAKLRAYFRAARNPDWTVKVIPGADHDFWMAEGPRIERSHYAPGYFDTVIDWIVAHTGKRRASPTPARR